jgi:hypothetical protein
MSKRRLVVLAAATAIVAGAIVLAALSPQPLPPDPPGLDEKLAPVVPIDHEVDRHSI